MEKELEKKIEEAGKVIDGFVDFNAIGAKVSNKAVRLILSSFELVDGYVFKVALKEVVQLIPEKNHPIVSAYLDALIQKDYLIVVDKTADMLTALNLIPLVDEDDEKRLYTAILIALVRLIPVKNW